MIAIKCSYMEEHIFTTKQKVILWAAISVIALLFGILAFCIDEDYISRFSLWASLLFGTGSLMVSVLALTISIVSFRKTEAARIQRNEEKANQFIQDNNDEILYLPLCLIANSFDNHHKYKRNIYNEFNLLNREIQKEVLKQMQYDDYEIIIGKGWINKGIGLVKKFIKDNNLGRDLLYDNAKYFHRAMRYSDLPYDGKVEFEHIMPDLFGWNYKPKGKKRSAENISFDSYLESYLEAKEKDSSAFRKHKNMRPIDVLASIIDFGEGEESFVCSWMMEVVATVAIRMSVKQIEKNDNNALQLTSGDAVIETFEDRYLDVLMELYNLSVVC